MNFIKNKSIKSLNIRFLSKLKKKVNRSIYIKLITWTSISIIISCLIGFLMIEILKPVGPLKQIHVDYDMDRNHSDKEILGFIRELYENKDREEEYIKSKLPKFNGDTYITDNEGNVVYRNEGNLNFIEKVNVEKIKGKMDKSPGNEYNVVYPLLIKDKIFYLIQSKLLYGHATYTNEFIYIISIIIAFSLFIALMFVGVRKKIIYIEYISSSLDNISKGDLGYEVEVKGEDELAQVAKEINNMEKALLIKIDEERKIENQKTELITNISHDLKTPLTIILGYLDIIRIKQYKTEEEKDKYIDITYNKALSLQKMVLKLFELVKLNDGEFSLIKREVNINKLLKQIVLDYEPLAEEKGITIDLECLKENINLNVDLDKLCRVFNNLIDNAIKYSPRNEIINIVLEKDEIGAKIMFKNKCNNLNEMDIDQLFNRFYRADKSRNSNIEGSGIGLSIAKKIVDLHDSSIWAERRGNEIVFILRLRG